MDPQTAVTVMAVAATLIAIIMISFYLGQKQPAAREEKPRQSPVHYQPRVSEAVSENPSDASVAPTAERQPAAVETPPDAETPRIASIPFPLDPAFTGRDDIIAAIETALPVGKPIILQGTGGMCGGVGVSSIAAHFAHNCEDRYQTIWWLRASDSSLLADDYISLGEALGLQFPEETDIFSKRSAIRRAMSDRSSWLMVFDGAESLNSIRSYIANSSTGHVLITTESTDWPIEPPPIRVRAFDRASSVSFLQRVIDQRSESGDAICQQLEDLPLAVSVAGGAIRNLTTPVSLYLPKVAEKIQQINDRQIDRGGCPVSAIAAVSIAIDEAGAISGAAEAILNLGGFIAPQLITPDSLAKCTHSLPEPLKMMYTNGFLGAMQVLADLRLATSTDDGIVFHKLVQTVARGRLIPETLRMWAHTAVVYSNTMLESCQADIDKTGLAASHATAAAQHAIKLGLCSEDVCRLLAGLGTHLRETGDLPKSEEYLERAVGIAEQIYGQQHPMVAVRLDDLAKTLAASGKQQKSYNCYEQALDIDVATYGDRNYGVATRLESMGNSLLHAGMPQEAKNQFERRLGIEQSLHSQDNPRNADALFNLGTAMCECGDPKGARELFEKAVQIWHTAYGATNPGLAVHMRNAAAAFGKAQDLERSYQYYSSAVRMDEAIFGTNSAKLIPGLRAMAEAARTLGDFEDASSILTRAIELAGASGGWSHPDTPALLLFMGEVREHLGDLDISYAYYQKALSMMDADQTSAGMEVAAIHVRVGTVLTKLNKRTDAHVHFEIAHAIALRTLGEQHPDTIRYRDIADIGG